MNLNEFMCNIPIYIIHLPDSVDRQLHLATAFRDYHIHIIDAVDGRNSALFNKYNISYTSSISLSDPLLAVICSHAKAIKSAYKSNTEYACIFEDDVHTDLIPTCTFTLHDICMLNSEWEAIQLFYTTADTCIIDNMHTNYVENGLSLIKRGANYSGTCYIINRKGMKNFLENVITVNDEMNTFSIKHPVIDPEDTILKYINTYIVNRQIFYYYFPTMTFESYTPSNPTSKHECQIIHFLTQQKLHSLYTK